MFAPNILNAYYDLTQGFGICFVDHLTSTQEPRATFSTTQVVRLAFYDVTPREGCSFGASVRGFSVKEWLLTLEPFGAELLRWRCRTCQFFMGS